MEEDISLCYLQYNMCLWEEDNSNISKFASVLWPAKDQLNCWKIKLLKNKHFKSLERNQKKY